MKISLSRVVAVVATTALASSALGHSDVLVRRDGTKVQIGSAAELDEDPEFDLETRVFEGVFIKPGTPFDFTFTREEPGFFSGESAPGFPTPTTPGLPLPTNADVTLSFSPFNLGGPADTTFYWDGTGAVDFQPLSLAQPLVSDEIDPAQFTNTGPSAAFDTHPDFGIDGPALDGVYLSRYVLDVAGLETSDPFFIVWLAESDFVTEVDPDDTVPTAEAFEEALEAFEDGDATDIIVAGENYNFYEEAVEFAAAIPEPNSVALAMIGLVAAARRRRR